MKNFRLFLRSSFFCGCYHSYFRTVILIGNTCFAGYSRSTIQLNYETYVTVPLYLLVDKMKDAIIAKVALQAADLYKEANAACQVTSVKQQLEKVKGIFNTYSGAQQARASRAS